LDTALENRSCLNRHAMFVEVHEPIWESAWKGGRRWWCRDLIYALTYPVCQGSFCKLHFVISLFKVVNFCAQLDHLQLVFRNYFSHPSFSYLFFDNPINKTETRTGNGYSTTTVQ
jgi:hypothetical protein